MRPLVSPALHNYLVSCMGSLPRGSEPKAPCDCRESASIKPVLMQDNLQMLRLSGGGSITSQSSWTWCRMCCRMTWQMTPMLALPCHHQALPPVLRPQGAGKLHKFRAPWRCLVCDLLRRSHLTRSTVSTADVSVHTNWQVMDGVFALD